jgi:hypothetical protein
VESPKELKKEMYHTQEKREMALTEPIICVRSDAWLGEAYYFWYDIIDAKEWGHNSKRKTGAFDVYKSDIGSENILDTVFNEDHYLFWLGEIEKVSKFLTKKTKRKPSLKEINQYFKERATWDEVDGIMFQDIPKSETKSLVREFYYRKRIQLAVYNVKIINTFVYVYSAIVV